MFMLIK